MTCQTRSKAKQKAEQQQNLRQTRSSRRRQESDDATPDVIYIRTRRLVKKRPVRAAASNIGNPRSKRSKPRAKQQAPRVPTTFNSLPTELRLMIWEEFVRTPRIIYIDALQDITESKDGYTCFFQSHNLYPRKSVQVCPLIGVNHETRRVALKEPLIHFKVEIPVTNHRRFKLDETISYTFSMRHHDIIFFDNSGACQLKRTWFGGQARDVRNVMMDVDVSDIDYKSRDALPQWTTILRQGQRLVDKLGNKDCLQNFYCLMRDHGQNGADKPEPYDLTDVQEMTQKHVSRFPEERRDDILRRLQEYENRLFIFL